MKGTGTGTGTNRLRSLSRMLPFLTGLGAALGVKERTPVMDVRTMMTMPSTMHYNIPPASRRGHSGVPRARRAAAKRANQIKGGRR